MPRAPAATVSGGKRRPAPAGIDERVLAAGTTLRFVLLLLLLAAAGATMVPRVVRHLLASPQLADKEAGCWLAAGIDTGGPLNASYVQFTRNAAAFKACTARYQQDFDGVSLAVGAGAVAVAVAVYWLLPVWRTRRSRVAPLDAMDVHGGLRPLLDDLVTVAGVTRPPRFVVDPAAPTVSAVAFGRRRGPTIRLDGGLVATCDTHREQFRAVVLHELAHLRAGDTPVTYATVALWRVFLVLVLLPWAAVGVDILLVAGTPGVRGQFAPFNTHELVLGCAIVLAVHLTRAGILRHREIYADLMAVRWGASGELWEAYARQPSWAGPRPLTGFVELWRSHPSWALRRASLTDPRALFALERLPLFLTGLATDVLVWHLGSLPDASVPVRAVLVAGLVVGVGGVALWRAVLYARLTGRPVPSGAPVGLWLGAGLVVGELAGPGAAYNHWLPPHPEALLILVAALVLVMAWTAQNAAWWLGSWRGRSLGPAMLLGLAAPALALASVLWWWYGDGQVLTDGWPYTTAGLLGSYGLPGLPPAHIGPLLEVVAVVGVLPGTDASVESFWWAGVLLWLVPLLALLAPALRPSSGPPKWLAGALSQTAGPPVPIGDAGNRPGLGRLLAAGLAGGLVCWAGLALARSRLHRPGPAAVGTTGPFQLTQLMGPVLVICCAMALTAAVVAAVTDTGRLPAGLVAAGCAALLGAGGNWLLMAADGCLGPLDTVAGGCGWHPWAAGRLLRIELAYTGSLGTLLAGAAAFVGGGAGVLGRRLGRAGRRRSAARVRPRRSRRRVWERGVRVAAVVVVAAGIGTTVFAVQASGSAARPSRSPELMLDQSTPAPSAALVRLEGQAWAAVGGLDHLNAFMSAQRGYTAASKAVGNSTSEAGFATAMGRLSTRCATIDRVTRSARGYFTVPEPTGQRMWSDLLTRQREFAAACRELTRRPGAGTAEAATTARQNAVDATDAMIYWLAETGAIRQKPA
ncbi:M56 family metallopeptidase [Streptomyces griseoviridis]|uniref:M56 family metallopeptidase n=1 Tax=Streptomyces griseoviridis TaxID=45398 RepID=UPI003401A8AE